MVMMPSTEVDLDTCCREDLLELPLSGTLTIYLPLPSFGRTNSHIDICDDLIFASWAAEKLSRFADSYAADEDYEKAPWTRVRLTLKGVHPNIRDALLDCLLIFRGEDEAEDEASRYEELYETIADYADSIDDIDPNVPEMVDWYYTNLVMGANYEYDSEAPEYLTEQFTNHPEHQVKFFRSAFSNRLGAHSYASKSSWVVPCSVDANKFFDVTGQKFRFEEFIPGKIFTVEGQSFVLSEGEILHFPISQYFKSRVCLGLAKKDNEEGPRDQFYWKDASFTFSQDHEALRLHFPELVSFPLREMCFVHKSGSMILVEDGRNRHYFYDTAFLNQFEAKRVNDQVAELAASLSSFLGLSPDGKCDWASLSDEDFERLCYDIIYADPKFDLQTIQKMGKSRSRDGGRDIVVFEARHGHLTSPRKWIFQCKLVRDGSSLTGARLTNVGDMLDQYEAQGFGVMTSALIDATLYDKLNAVCEKRRVVQRHFSILELERHLARYAAIRKKYFPD